MQNQLNDSAYRRLAWQCRRGMRELDDLLSGFLAQGYAGLDSDGRAAFDALLAYPDAVLLELLMGRMTPADKDAAGIVRAIRDTAAV
jgi:antitoxin CptB